MGGGEGVLTQRGRAGAKKCKGAKVGDTDTSSGLRSRQSGVRFGLSGSGTGAGPEPGPSAEYLNLGPDGRDPGPESLYLLSSYYTLSLYCFRFARFSGLGRMGL